MVYWICGVRLEYCIRTKKLHKKLEMVANTCPRRLNDYLVLGILPRGHPQLCWSDVIRKDLKDLNIWKELVHEWVELQKAIMPRTIQLQRV